MTKKIPLTQSKVALVSDHRFTFLNQWTWSALRIRGKWYAVRGEGTRPNHKIIYMHRQITNAPAGTEVDHKDGDGLNCQDENLRVCSRSENARNSTKTKRNTTGFKGVSRLGKKFSVNIRANGKLIYLGLFDTAEEGARAYDEAAKRLHGEFAKLNFEV